MQKFTYKREKSSNESMCGGLNDPGMQLMTDHVDALTGYVAVDTLNICSPKQELLPYNCTEHKKSVPQYQAANPSKYEQSFQDQ